MKQRFFLVAEITSTLARLSVTAVILFVDVFWVE